LSARFSKGGSRTASTKGIFKTQETEMQPEEVIAAVKDKAKANFKTGLN
jgi:hypothetical protein